MACLHLEPLQLHSHYVGAVRSATVTATVSHRATVFGWAQQTVRLPPTHFLGLWAPGSMAWPGKSFPSKWEMCVAIVYLLAVAAAVACASEQLAEPLAVVVAAASASHAQHTRPWNCACAKFGHPWCGRFAQPQPSQKPPPPR